MISNKKLTLKVKTHLSAHTQKKKKKKKKKTAMMIAWLQSVVVMIIKRMILTMKLSERYESNGNMSILTSHIV